MSDLKEEKLIKNQTYMKTETCKLYSRDFWIFLPNIIKIDLYNFELYRFKVGPFFWDTVYNVCDNTLCLKDVPLLVIYNFFACTKIHKIWQLEKQHFLGTNYFYMFNVDISVAFCMTLQCLKTWWLATIITFLEHNSIYAECPFVCLSHRWIIQERFQLGLYIFILQYTHPSSFYGMSSIQKF